MSQLRRESVLVELTKQIATVAGALLALLASLTPVFLAHLNEPTFYAILVSGLALLLSALLSLYSHAKTIAYVGATDATARAREWNKAAGSANIAFFVFGISLAFLFGGGASQLFWPKQKVGFEVSVSRATQFLQDEGKIGSTESWESIETITGKSEDTLKIKYSPTSKAAITCQVNPMDGNILGCK